MKSYLKTALVQFLFQRFMKGIGLFGTSFFYLVFLAYLFPINSSLTIKALIGFTLIEIISAIIKIKYHKHRPIPSNNTTLLEKYESGSFPSIHSARITGLAILTYQLIPDNLIINIYSLILVILVSISRVYTKRHYLIDVIAGILIGSIIFTLIMFN